MTPDDAKKFLRTDKKVRKAIKKAHLDHKKCLQTLTWWLDETKHVRQEARDVLAEEG